MTQSPFEKLWKHWDSFAEAHESGDFRWGYYAVKKELNALLESQAKKADKDGNWELNPMIKTSHYERAYAFRLVKGDVGPTVMRNDHSSDGHVMKGEGVREINGKTRLRERATISGSVSARLNAVAPVSSPPVSPIKKRSEVQGTAQNKTNESKRKVCIGKNNRAKPEKPKLLKHNLPTKK